MTWTTPADLKAQVQKLWDRGLLPAILAGGAAVFPKRLTLKGPGSRDLSNRFPEVRDWIARLSDAAGQYRIEWRSFNHRVLGVNRIPAAIWIDTLEDALGLIGKRRAADQFSALVDLTRQQQPKLVPWLARRPLRALELSADWPQLLALAAWLIEHPRPGLYLRQIDLPGVHTKLIEGHRGVLAELLDLVLPPEAIDVAWTGSSGFCRRYGFLDKPLRVRFRLLDPAIQVLATNNTAGAVCSSLPRTESSAQDITLTQPAFAALDLPVATVFITENEINFLAFPPVAQALVIFGAGYGFENIASSAWLQSKHVYYWGDIDTHGFAILNQLRSVLPGAVSLLMDRQTLLHHRQLWGIEAQQETATLARLTTGESTLCDQLRQNHWGDRVRLEQERIGFQYLRAALRRLRP
jgi:hypothetical protein